MTPLDHHIEAVSFDYERTSWEVLDASVAGDFRYLQTVAHGDLQIVSQTLDNQQWIVAYLMDDGPIRYYRYDRAEKTATSFSPTAKTWSICPWCGCSPWSSRPAMG